MSSTRRGGCKLIIKTINNKITSYFPPSPTAEDIDTEADTHSEQPEKETDVTRVVPPIENGQSHPDLPTPDCTPTKDTTCVTLPSPGLDTPHKIQLVTKSNPPPSDQQKEDCIGKENCVRGKVQPHQQCQQQAGKDDTLSRRLCDSPKPTQPKVTKCDVTETGQTHKGRKGPSRSWKTTGASQQAKPSAMKSTSTAQTKNKSMASSKTSVKKAPEPTPNLLTNYFTIRRSSRRTHSDLKKERLAELAKAIMEDQTSGLSVEEIPGKGRGVVATQPFARGDFVVEYVGDLISLGDAKDREKDYSANPEFGCYMYYFNHNNKRYCLDATAESGKLGRLVNHSCKRPNCVTKVVPINDHPYLILIAARNIRAGEELLYDYGDRSKESLAAHPWLTL